MLNLWHAYIRAAQVGWDVNVVVAMRLMRLAAGGALAQREAQRMVAEKVTAIAEAQANDNGRWNGCRDKIRFRCLSAEGAGKPTLPHPTLISSVPGVLRALRQRWYEMTPEGAANSTSFKMEGSGSGGGSYALPYVSRKTTDAAVIESIVWSATSEEPRH